MENNGGIHYCDFRLMDDMSPFTAREKVSNHSRPPYFYLNPSEGFLSETFYGRWGTYDKGPSKWQDFDTTLLTNLRWSSYNWEGRFKTDLQIIALPEFLCRYGFVSSFASQINRFRLAGGIEVPGEMLHELVYLALLSSSQVMFYYILEIFIGEKEIMLEKYRSAKKENNGDTDVTVFRKYQAICREHEFPSMTGGPYTRVQPQPVTHAIFKCDDALRNNLKKIPQLLHNLDTGKYLGHDGLVSGPTATRLKQVGEVASLSFAPLAVFCGLATTEHAINTAKQSPLNTESTNSYFHNLKKFMDKHDNQEGQKELNWEKQIYVPYFLRMFRSIAKSWGTVAGSIENGCCATFRGSQKVDVFFRNQDLYILDDLCSLPKVKRYGSDEWVELTFSSNNN